MYGIDVWETVDFYSHFNLSTDNFNNIWRDLKSCYPDVHYQFYESHSIPFDDGFFDAVVYYAALEHILRNLIINSLNESYRVLNDTGKLFVFRCPNAISFCENVARFFGIPGHEILYRENELIRLIQGSKFNVSDFQKTDLFPAFFPISFQRFLDINGFWLLPFQSFLQCIGFKRWAHHFSVVATKKNNSLGGKESWASLRI